MITANHRILAALIVSWLGITVFPLPSPSPGAKPPPDDSLKTFYPGSSISVTVTIAAGKSETLLPHAFSLSQNHPNPFNPETIIRYALPEDCHVELTIHNILGQKVMTLVNEYQKAGYKMIHWNGRNERGSELPSGLYFYTLKALTYQQTKKMVLLR
jgi:flagellar hook assembly protein FlgD